MSKTRVRSVFSAMQCYIHIARVCNIFNVLEGSLTFTPIISPPLSSISFAIFSQFRTPVMRSLSRLSWTRRDGSIAQARNG